MSVATVDFDKDVRAPVLDRTMVMLQRAVASAGMDPDELRLVRRVVTDIFEREHQPILTGKSPKSNVSFLPRPLTKKLHETEHLVRTSTVAFRKDPRLVPIGVKGHAKLTLNRKHLWQMGVQDIPARDAALMINPHTISMSVFQFKIDAWAALRNLKRTAQLHLNTRRVQQIMTRAWAKLLYPNDPSAKPRAIADVIETVIPAVRPSQHVKLNTGNYRQLVKFGWRVIHAMEHRLGDAHRKAKGQLAREVTQSLANAWSQRPSKGSALTVQKVAQMAVCTIMCIVFQWSQDRLGSEVTARAAKKLTEWDEQAELAEQRLLRDMLEPPESPSDSTGGAALKEPSPPVGPDGAHDPEGAPQP